ncbi:MAG: hypothetical protein H0W88_07445 [Parachlamydiaceae bacterium]|nr:hypothetical protein [Parachlamydiaceae bacterium]
MSVSTITQRLQNNDPTLAKLDHKSKMNVEERQAFFLALKVNHTVQELMITNTELGTVGGRELGKCLIANRSITQLSLAEHQLTNEGFNALCAGLNKNTTLTEFQITEKFDLEKTRALVKVIKKNVTLKKLCLIGSPHSKSLFDYDISAESDTELAKTIGEKNALQEFTTNFKLSSFAVEILADGLRMHCTLVTLNLSNGFLTSNHALLIADSLKTNTRLQELNLSNNNYSFAERTEKAIVEMLKINRTLKKLVLTLNNFGSEGGLNILESLENNQFLRELILQGLRGESINIIVVKAISKMLKTNNFLLVLDLRNNEMGPEAAVEIAKALIVNKRLNTILLSNNYIGPDAGMAFVEVINKNNTLKVLDLSNNFLGLKTAKALEVGLMKNTYLVSFRLDDNRCDGNFGTMSVLFERERATRFLLSKSNPTGVKNYIKYLEKIFETMDDPTHKDIEKSIQKKLESNRLLADKQKKEKVESKKGEKEPIVQVQSQQITTVRCETEERKENSSGINKDKDHFSLGIEELEKIKALPDADGMHSILAAAKALENIDLKVLEALKGQAEHLQELFESSAKAHHTDAEIAYISDNPILDTYYRYFSRQLTSIWLACLTINSGIVKNSEQYTSEYFSAGLKKIGDHIPGISIATSIIDEVIGTWNYRDKRIGVQRVASLFRDLETAFKELSILARQLTLSQEDILKQIPSKTKGFVAKLEEGFHDMKASILADDIDNPIKRKAVADCSIILTAIKEGKYEQKAAVASLLTVVMGRGFVFRSAVTLTAASLTVVSTEKQEFSSFTDQPKAAGAGAQTNGTEDLYKKMQEMEKRLEKRVKDTEEEARKAVELAKKNGSSDVTVSGGHSAMVLASPHNNDIAYQDSNDKMLALQGKQIGIHTNRFEEQEEQIRQQQLRIDNLEETIKKVVSKKERDSICLLM